MPINVRCFEKIDEKYETIFGAVLLSILFLREKIYILKYDFCCNPELSCIN